MKNNDSPAINPAILPVFETLPYHCLVLSADLIMLTCSNAYLKLTGKGKSEITDRYIFDVFPETLQWTDGVNGGLPYSLRQVQETKKPHEMPILRFDIADPEKSGSTLERHWKIINTPVLDDAGNITYIIHDTNDVTEQVIKEQHLQESLKIEKQATVKAQLLSVQMEKLFHEIPAQIAIVSGPDLVYDYINPQYKEELFPNRDVMGMPALTALPELKDSYTLRIVKKVYDTKETHVESAIHIQLADKIGAELKDHYFNVVYQPIVDEKGETTGVLSFKYEITEHVAARKLLEKREKELILVNDELNRAHDELQASNEELHTAGEELLATNEELTVTNEEVYKAHEDLLILNEQLEERVRLRTEELQHYREEAESQRDRLRFLLNAIPHQVWTATPDGSVNSLNEVIVSNFGFSPEQILANGLSAFMHPDDLPQTRDLWLEAFRSGKEFQAEFRLKFADGSYRWHLGRAVPLIEDGKVSFWLGTSTNIDFQKTNEHKKDEFLSIASHELKTPLTSIKAFNQLMRLTNVSEKTSSYLEKSFNNINRLEKLVNDLLDVTRINAGKMVYDLQEFDFNVMLQDTIESVQLTASTHQIILESNVTSSFVGDRLRLEQVVNNLLSNAVKYSPEGKEVLVKSIVEDDHIIVSVQDYGIGIENQHLHQLFDRYYRTDNTHMRFEGLGLGLFISAEIVKRHSGNLWIESELGKGSCFYFRLPINPKKRTSPVIESANYYKDEHITITYKEAENHLYADWTGYQKFESVKNAGLKILELVRHTKTCQLLNDNTNVLGTWSEAADWVAQELLPMLENAGLQFIAWIHSPSAFSKLSAEKAADLTVGKVTIRFFTDRDAALEWLKDE